MATIAGANAAARTAIGGGVPGSAVERFLMNAMRFLGQPYKWGGGHGSTFAGPGPVDCSGLVQQAARLAGLNLDGTAATQQAKARPIGMAELRPGDLVFRGRPARHVGIYIGDGKVIHAPKTGDVVKIVDVGYFESAGRPAAFANAGPVAPVAPAAPGKPAAPRPAAPPPLPRDQGAQRPAGVPAAVGLPPAPIVPGGPVPAYAERFGGQGYVRDGANGDLLALAKAAIARAPELAGTALGEAVAAGRLGRDDVRALQTFLEAKGYSVGDTGVDGLYGPRTHRAMKAFLEGAAPDMATAG